MSKMLAQKAKLKESELLAGAPSLRPDDKWLKMGNLGPVISLLTKRAM
jgi:hypothetical protein